jgi:tight adherence protein B
VRPLALALSVAGIAALFVFWRSAHTRRIAVDRLAAMIDTSTGAEPRGRSAHRTVPPFPPRYRWLPPAVGIAFGATMWIAVGFPLPIAAAIGILIGVLAALIEAYIGERQEALIEVQLAAAIDLLVSSLRAGASLLAAFESALQETEAPLRPYFQEVAGRIRLGDDPRSAVSDLQVRVPLESFRLFATSLEIHWEVGGSLATTLSTVGATVRDRIELSRRVRAQGVESNASVAVVLAISYVLGFLMWQTNPQRMEAFGRTGLGTALVTAAIGLQAIGLVWMTRLSRSRF